MKQYNKLNITFSVARVFAVLSIVSAHVNISEPGWVGKMINAFGSIGVVVFIILSGYFYHSEKYKSILEMLAEKSKTVIIPWFVFGSFYYLWSVFAGAKALSILSWIGYILGNGTFLYYLTVLILCYCIFYKRNKIVMYASMLLSVISVYLTAFGLLDRIIDALNITNYLNIFNWIGYFAIGYLLQEKKNQEIYDFLKQTMFVSISLFLVLYALICIFNIETGYFSYIGILYQLIGAWAIFSISTLPVFDKSIVHNISNMTFGVYLLHMITISSVLKICSVTNITKLFTPIAVIITCLVLLYAGYVIAKKLHLDNLYCILTGVRMKRNIKK